MGTPAMELEEALRSADELVDYYTRIASVFMCSERF